MWWERVGNKKNMGIGLSLKLVQVREEKEKKGYYECLVCKTKVVKGSECAFCNMELPFKRVDEMIQEIKGW
jgi:hypothetical protein